MEHTKTAEGGLIEFHSGNQQPSLLWYHLCTQGGTDTTATAESTRLELPLPIRHQDPKHAGQAATAARPAAATMKHLICVGACYLDTILTYVPTRRLLFVVCTLVLVVVLVLPGSGRYRPSS